MNSSGSNMGGRGGRGRYWRQPVRRDAIDRGKYRYPIRIERRVETVDAGQGASVQWQLVTRAWASYEPLTNVERLRYQQMASPINVRLCIPFNPTVTLDTSMRIVDSWGNWLHIHSLIIVKGERRELEIMAEDTGQPI